ncbi:putative NAD(+) kinase [Rosa chinensis]|uniref:NAD(+) kinase n=1 Tax=Rosa chinensis TaxID=74649 RepID=A0A2P6PXH5_ROSCH|nr:NAD kinase 2, chloroplastic [Rosa chinensis]PRQ26629.1 putative NAD(+) kinase [Rosa chinensis]
MVACCLMCQVAIAVDMSRCAASPPNLCPLQFSGSPAKLFGFGFDIQKKDRLKRRLKFVVSAELSKPFSLSFGLDSQGYQLHDPSQSRRIGPVPGDIAEIEAYCRIFRSAERLHTALMETLCNPVTGVCSVYYDFPSEEKPLLEDKIVSVIGCMVSLLNKAREDVLSGRSAIMSSFRGVVDVAEVEEDMLPPLAVFRSELKRCCESLHVALEDWLMPGDEQSLDVWRKLQRLKNVCYDSGFPREEDYPCNTLFANWTPVYLSSSKEDVRSEDSEVAFWRGGQVTEEGLEWLLEKGFKTLVDLRAEIVKDNIYQAAVDDAIASGKVELIRIPVEVGTAPSMEQVEKFASLVSDCSKKPIYLHSKEGLWRTSAMLSRWRQHLTRRAVQFVSKQSVSLNGEVGKPSTMQKSSLLEKKNESLDTIHGSNGVLQKNDSVDRDEANLNGTCNSLISIQGLRSVESDESEPLVNFCREVDPLNAQVPPCNIFSRKEMSRFLERKNIAPLTYFNYQLNRLKVLPISRYMNTKIMWRGEIVDTDSVREVVEAENSNGIPDAEHLLPEFQISASGNGKYLTGAGNGSVTAVVNGFGEGEKGSLLAANLSTNTSNNHSESVLSKAVKLERKSNGRAPLVSSDDELGSIEGDMCASATGVVRVQSRKKAEMFLVRTDGFSCTREKVTESSLAFTHPSTQQQMLMWKSTPKTVLVLKKLGHELMEQAKEVVSFLYYQEKMNVLVEPDVHDVFARIPGFGFVQTFYTQDTGDLHERVDFVACLGGDGVILHASNLFKGAVPPIVSFNLGSLGFLTSHTFDDYRQDLRQVIHGNNTSDGVYITLRMRLRCEIFRNGKAMPGKVFDVLNEIVVDRGSNPYLSKIECYERDQLITKVQGDGVIVATPTGSTAYSTAAGGSMVHPNVPCMLFTPICPHSLSFRPVILPDSASLELKIPEDARSNAWVSFDGKRRQQLSRGDSVRIAMSQHPLPTVNKRDQTGDWFRSLIRCLNWNERLDQKAL